MLALIGVLGFAYAVLMVFTVGLGIVSAAWEAWHFRRKERRMQHLIQSIKQELAAERQQHPLILPIPPLKLPIGFTQPVGKFFSEPLINLLYVPIKPPRHMLPTVCV